MVTIGGNGEALDAGSSLNRIDEDADDVDGKRGWQAGRG
jgi:hypothetical protein